MKRITSDKTNIWLTAILVVANLFILNAIISNWNAARLDLTEYKEHSLSSYTKKVINELPDKVEVIALFSTSTHKLLKPLIPRIKDVLEDYISESNGKVEVIFMDPKKDKTISKIYEEYGIKPMPVPLESKYKKEVKSIYFDLAIRFGDQTIKYGIDELIKVKQDTNGPIVSLKNIEALVTKGIKKVSTSFVSMDSVMESLETPIKITYMKLPEKYLTSVPPKQLKDLQEAESKLKKSVEELTKKYKGKITYEQKNAENQQKVFVVEVAYGSKTIDFPLFTNLNSTSKSDVSENLKAAIKRVLPGFGKTLGLVVPKVQPPMNPMMRRQAPPNIYRVLDSLLGNEYEIKHPDLSNGVPPTNVDILMVVQPENLTEKEVYAIDQYVMLGGKVVVFADRGKLDLASLSTNKLKLNYVKTGIDLLLATWGITFENKILGDKQSFPYPLPKEIQPGLVVVQETPYNFFVKASPSQTNPITSGIELINLTWSGVLNYHNTNKNINHEVLLESSSNAFAKKIDDTNGLDVTPSSKNDETSEKRRTYTVALSLEGKFESLYKNRKSPFEENNENKTDDKTSKTNQKTDDKNKTDDKTAKTNQKTKQDSKVLNSPKTKIVVVADADFISDLGMKIAGDRYEFTYKFINNILEWLQSDDDTVSIKPKGLPRPLKDLADTKKAMIQHIVWIGSLIVLAGIFLLLLSIRRRDEK